MKRIELRPYTFELDLEIRNLIDMIHFLFQKSLDIKGTDHKEYNNNRRSLILYDERLTKLTNIKYNRENLVISL